MKYLFPLLWKLSSYYAIQNAGHELFLWILKYLECVGESHILMYLVSDQIHIEYLQ